MITLVMGGQYGSEGKGSVVSWLAKNNLFDLAIRTGSPNAGHTFVDKFGRTHKMRQLPCTWAFQDIPIYLPSSVVINKEVLFSEVQLLRNSGYMSMIYISPEAAVIPEKAGEFEKGIKTGTTGEGVGFTRAQKCMRALTVVRDDPFFHEPLRHYGVEVERLDTDGYPEVLVESTQGFGLSLNSRYYPFVTSTNLNPHQLLSDAEISFDTDILDIWMVLRTYPIRIAGDSGYLYKELSWDELRKRHGEHIPTEQTTVTKKTRRVGEFDEDLAKEAIRVCNPDKIVLTFFDYLFPRLADSGNMSVATQPELAALRRYEQKIGHRITHLGVGTGDLLEVYNLAVR